MKYTNLGRSGLRVSRLCLGTMNFGMTTDEKEAHKIMDCAREAGINFFDTADMYGGKSGTGASETMIGNWFAKGGGRREDTVLTTKCFFAIRAGNDPNEANGLSGYKIRRHLENSLQRLQTDRVELYLMHHPDPTADWVDLLDTLQAAVYHGKVDYIGTSNRTAFELAQVQNLANQRHFFGLACEQHCYHMLERTLEIELARAVKELGIGLTTFSPMGGGLFGNKIFDPLPDSRSAAWNLNEKITGQLKQYHQLCSDIGETPARVALAWVLHNPVVTAPLIGVRTAEQLEDSIRALEIELSPEFLAKIDEIFPPHKKFDRRPLMKAMPNRDAVRR